MSTSRASAAAFWALTACLSLGVAGCCFCFGSDWEQFAPPTVDDAGAQAEARRYWQENADGVVGLLTEDTGPLGAEGCVSGLGALAATAVVAVVSRGHAGSDSAAQVSIEPGRCFSRIMVLVVLTAGVWHAVSLVADTLDGRTVSFGATGTPFLLQETVGGSGDSDWGSDELF
jgi:hypothetical protein